MELNRITQSPYRPAQDSFVVVSNGENATGSQAGGGVVVALPEGEWLYDTSKGVNGMNSSRQKTAGCGVRAGHG